MIRSLLCLSLLLAALAQTAVPAVHTDCGSVCSSNTTCCGSDSFCAGNAISQRCCPNDSGFCGCISNRGYCSGFVYGDSSRVAGEDSFGTCFNSAEGSCTYDPNSNNWVVCPSTYSSCPSNSGFSCCASDQTCFTTSGASYAACAYPSGGPTVNFPQSDQTLYYNTAYTFNYNPTTAGDTNYQVITGGNNQAYGQGTENNDGTISFEYTLRSFSPSNGFINLTFIEGNSSTTVQVYAATATSSSSTSAAATQATQAEAVDTQDCGPNGCAGGALCCGGQCYSSGQYTCYQRTNGAYQLCPKGDNICGSACYNPNTYACSNEQLALV